MPADGWADRFLTGAVLLMLAAEEAVGVAAAFIEHRRSLPYGRGTVDAGS